MIYEDGDILPVLHKYPTILSSLHYLRYDLLAVREQILHATACSEKQCSSTVNIFEAQCRITAGNVFNSHRLDYHTRETTGSMSEASGFVEAADAQPG